MIGDNIKRLRMEKGMTQKELADKLFVTAQAVSRWENGEVEPSVSTVAEMTRIFNVPGDVILGIKGFNSQTETVVETKYVYQEQVKPVLGICGSCHNPIYEKEKIGSQSRGNLYCKDCVDKRDETEKQNTIAKAIRRRKLSFFLGGLFLAIALIVGISNTVETHSVIGVLEGLLVGVIGFCYISCCLLGNNFIGEMTLTIFSWGFVKMPGVIFTLDLDGIVWLLTVKLLFWILGFALAIFFLGLGIVLGGILSIFVYPFALKKNLKHPELSDFNL